MPAVRINNTHADTSSLAGDDSEDDFDWEEVEVAQQPAGVQVDAVTASSLQDYYAALQSAAEGAGASSSSAPTSAQVQGRAPLEITIQTLGKGKGKVDPQ